MRCAEGHDNAYGRQVCGECGLPLTRVRVGARRAGWLADPLGRHELRYWDGDEWTAHVSDGGIPGTDDLITLPAIAVTLPVPGPTRGPMAPPVPGDDVVPSRRPVRSAVVAPRRRLWPWLVAAAVVVLGVFVVVAGRSDTSGAEPALRGTPTTTLPMAECQRIVLESQAGIRPVTTAVYRHECGPVPAGVVLRASGTTAGP